MVIVQLVGAVAALRGLERPVADDVHGLQTVSHVADKGDDVHVRGRVRGQDAIVKVRRAVVPDQGDPFRPNTLFVGLQNKLKVHDKASGVLVRLCLRPYDAPGGDVKEVRACKDLRLAVHADDALPREKLPPCRVAAKFLKQRSENALAALVGPRDGVSDDVRRRKRVARAREAHCCRDAIFLGGVRGRGCALLPGRAVSEGVMQPALLSVSLSLAVLLAGGSQRGGVACGDTGTAARSAYS